MDVPYTCGTLAATVCLPRWRIAPLPGTPPVSSGLTWTGAGLHTRHVANSQGDLLQPRCQTSPCAALASCTATWAASAARLTATHLWLGPTTPCTPARHMGSMTSRHTWSPGDSVSLIRQAGIPRSSSAPCLKAPPIAKSRDAPDPSLPTCSDQVPDQSRPPDLSGLGDPLRFGPKRT